MGLPSLREAVRRHPGAWSLGAAFAASLLLRGLYLWGAPDRDWPFSIFFAGDARFFHTAAVDLARGRDAATALPYHPPLFPALLGGLYHLLGEPRGSALPYKLALACVGAATVALCLGWWRRLLGPAWSAVAAGLYATSFGWLVLSTTYSNETLSALWLCFTCALVLKGGESLSWPAAVALGAVMGLGTLTRAEHLGLWPFLLVYAWTARERERPPRPWLWRWGAAVGVSLLVLVPGAVRNLDTMRTLNAQAPHLEPLPEWVPVTVYGPLNFAMANHAGATGGFTPALINQGGSNGQLEPSRPEHRRLLLHGYAEGLRWMVAAPGDAARLAWTKLDLWLDGLRLGVGVSDVPGGLVGARAPVDVFVPDDARLKWPLTALLLAGMLLSLRPAFAPFRLLSLVVLHRVLVTLAFFGYARGLLVVFPALLPLLVLPLKVLAERRAAVARGAPVVALALLLLLWLEAAVLATREPPRRFMASGSTDATNGKLIQDDRVRLWPQP
ncbi:glycosyltransferase family 39 protein [Corallococcus sp. BB11-1]|uniref:ArnT family glycosyltransferase n=1 Tax=Corallococcus sp. BB11-1 TaxID=2996783 RepID=UPI00226F63FE|nr:glycosyltransferase family 39 protein [Corallococcus sp. BB11-1]MCY1034615.1 glycosyltransferase family 39 protein [Corallococcus sp. BB11-1]